jgi:hypothetical protein
VASRLRLSDRNHGRQRRHSASRPRPYGNCDSKPNGIVQRHERSGGLCVWHLLGGCERGYRLGEAVVSAGR